MHFCRSHSARLLLTQSLLVEPYHHCLCYHHYNASGHSRLQSVAKLCSCSGHCTRRRPLDPRPGLDYGAAGTIDNHLCTADLQHQLAYPVSTMVLDLGLCDDQPYLLGIGRSIVCSVSNRMEPDSFFSRICSTSVSHPAGDVYHGEVFEQCRQE